MIPQETIDKIFEAARVEEVIGDFVNLKKTGVNYKGRCPFHDEKTPSFVVSPTKGIYKCFGCGKGGNSIMFIQDIQGASYPEALRYVAEKYHIEIIERLLTPEQESKLSAKESQFIATKFASDYFQDILWNSKEGRTIGLGYFKERGFSEETIKTFKLGYSPKKQNSFENAAIKAGYDRSILIDASLIGENENGKSYDKFRERTIFPIHSYSGKVIGFGGRAFNPEAKSKYLNSGETLNYDKSKVLYGLYLSKQEISKADRCFIVEGYTDVISMHQNGVKNVVSASGTALGEHQISLIKRSTNNVTLLYDGDTAGIKATIRSIDLCLKAEMNVRIASFPEGEDPDSYSKKLNSDEFKEYLDKNALNFVDYLIKIYNLNGQKEPERIIEIKKKIILSISEIPDVFSREEYCKIYHSKLDVSEKALLEQVTKARRMVKSKPIAKISKHSAEIKKTSPNKNTPKQKLQKQEEEILRLLINYGNETFIVDNEEGSVAGMIINELRQDKIELSNEEYHKLYNRIIDLMSEIGFIDIQKLINDSNSGLSKLTVDLIAQPHSISDNWQKRHNIITGREDEKMQQTTEKAILSLKKEIVDLQIIELQKKLKIGTISDEEIKTLSQKTKIKTTIAKILGRNIG
ncbi:MAG: DNA primase [Flavobacteriales bacterium]|nr:DNA primase [Flavobacteriales bacterium]|tara:strand:+ start:48844 stop:50745 length:1902 start_codon:yes stop_codon:yes gene_type:complete